MSVNEFEVFLHENYELYSKKESQEEFMATNRIKPMEGIALWDLSSDFPLHLIRYNDLWEKEELISRLYGDLSTYTHPNHWRRVKLGPGKSEFLPTHTKAAFHKCLKLILETHKTIFRLIDLNGIS